MTELLPIPEVYLLSTLDVIEAGLAHYQASAAKPAHFDVIYTQLTRWCQEQRSSLAPNAEED
jgi:hypothetical protein